MFVVIKLKIILVRHGETTANHLKLIQGWTDNPLNELGRKQANEAGKYLKEINYKPDLAISSPLVRASETGEIMLSHINNDLKMDIDFHFIERNFGPFENDEAIPTLKKVLKKGFNKPGFESDKMLINRVHTGIKNLYKFYKDKEIIIFCHSHVIKSFLILAEPENYDYKHFIGNGSLHKFSYNDTGLSLLEFSMNM